MPNGTIIVSEHYYTYLSTVCTDSYSYIVADVLHKDADGGIILTSTGDRIVPSANSTYDLGCISARWSLMQRFLANGMEINMAVRQAIRIYESVPADVVLTDHAVGLICAHYANDGDRSLAFEINHHGELTIRPVSQAN